MYQLEFVVKTASGGLAPQKYYLYYEGKEEATAAAQKHLTEGVIFTDEATDELLATPARNILEIRGKWDEKSRAAIVAAEAGGARTLIPRQPTQTTET